MAQGPILFLQVHTGTSSNASPENVSVFVGSDLTNSVTAPCMQHEELMDGKTMSLGSQGVTHTHTHTHLQASPKRCSKTFSQLESQNVATVDSSDMFVSQKVATVDHADMHVHVCTDMYCCAHHCLKTLFSQKEKRPTFWWIRVLSTFVAGTSS